MAQKLELGWGLPCLPSQLRAEAREDTVLVEEKLQPYKGGRGEGGR